MQGYLSRRPDRHPTGGQESGSAGVPSTSGWLVVEGARRGKTAGQQVSLCWIGEPCERGRGCVLRRPSCLGNNRYLMIDSGVERLNFGLMLSKLSNM